MLHIAALTGSGRISSPLGRSQSLGDSHEECDDPNTQSYLFGGQRACPMAYGQVPSTTYLRALNHFTGIVFQIPED